MVVPNIADADPMGRMTTVVPLCADASENRFDPNELEYMIAESWSSMTCA